MAISRVEIQGQFTRAQDFTTIKHNEDNKPLIDQSNYQKKFEQNVEVKMRQVRQGDKAENEGRRFDAKEKGGGVYYGDGGKKRKKQEKDERVVIKGQSGFDMKI